MVFSFVFWGGEGKGAFEGGEGGAKNQGFFRQVTNRRERLCGGLRLEIGDRGQIPRGSARIDQDKRVIGARRF